MAGTTIGESFDPHRNSLNFLRLVLALCVVVSHTDMLPRSVEVGIFRYTGLGTFAVYGFFGISGYLIAGSAVRNKSGRYLWQRCLRIFPAFWVCLIITALVFSPVIPLKHLGIYTWLIRPHTPIKYVVENWFLHIGQLDIYGTVWNASIWTIYYEFVCYLILGAFALVGILKRPPLLLGIAIVSWLTLLTLTIVPSFSRNFGPFSHGSWVSFVQLTPVFLAGSVLYIYRDRIPDSGWLALALSVGFMASLWLPNDGTGAAFGFTPEGLFAFLIAYPMIWLGIHLPFHKVGAKNDYSYGIYIYAFPVQVLLGYWGVRHWGSLTYGAMVILCTIPLAVASWWLVEKHALKLKQIDMAPLMDKVLGPPKVKVEAQSQTAKNTRRYRTGPLTDD